MKGRKIVSSFSAELPYLHIVGYFAQKMKIGKGAFIRLCIAYFARQFVTAKELDMKLSIRKSYLEIIEKEFISQTHFKNLKEEVENEEEGIDRKKFREDYKKLLP